jgi:hypothetical protein
VQDVASPAMPPQQPVAVSHDGLAEAINAGLTLAAQTNIADDYLKFAQGAKLLSDALVELTNAEHGAPDSGTPPEKVAGKPETAPVEQS